MDRSVFQELYKRHHSGPVRGTHSKEASSHWVEFSRYSDVKADADGNVLAVKGYGFGGSDDNRFVARLASETGNVLMTATLQMPGLSAYLKQARKQVSDMQLYFSQDAFRQACTAYFLQQQPSIQQSPPKKIVIIGDGFGVLAALLARAFPGADIYLIDLGVTLFFQSWFLSHAFPERKHHLVGFTQEEGDASRGFYYCEAENADAFPDIQLDLAINIASMQEMNPDMIKTYFDLLRSRHTKLFYCCNRLEKILPDGTAARIFEFPWSKEDLFLVDEECPWHKFFVGRVGPENVKLFGWLPVPLVKRYDGVHWHRLAKLYST
jgi:SAM-dependent methyltransferase